MWQRCTNPKRYGYQHYGGKGVHVCTAWKDFTVFLRDMGRRPSGHSLERIDVNGNYEPSNCKWANTTEQARNSVQVVWVELNGERKRLVEWCAEIGISINTVRDRVKFYGMDYQTALTTPNRNKLKEKRK